MRVDADNDDFIPNGTYLRDWYNVQDLHFNTLGSSIEAYVRDIDHSDPDNWGKLEELSEAFSTNKFMRESKSWFVEFRAYAGEEDELT